jgi:hypothetical protein
MDAALSRFWTKGLTSPQIAALIGGVTASAVRHAARRQGLTPRGSADLSFAGVHKAAPTPWKPTRPLPPDQLGPHAKPRLWTDREPGECAFPVESPDGLLACCGPIPLGARRPYCPFHLSLTVGVENAA